MALEKINIESHDDILELVKELQQAGDACVRNFKIVAERNEKFVQGEQYADLSPQMNLEDAWQPNTPRFTQNHLRNLVNTYKARITKDRPSVTAWPTSTKPEAIASAKISAKLIEYLEKELQIDLLLDDCVRLGAMHGMAGFKVCYNPIAGKVEWQKVSLFDVLIDPTKEDFDTASWCIFRVHIDKYEAKQILSTAGMDEDPPTCMYKVNDSEDREGVEVLELWHKPTARVPEGLFCKIIGTHVLDSRAYPYQFASLENPEDQSTEAVLPLVYFKIDYRRGYPYADTWLSDAIPEQRQINETEATLLRIRRETGNVKLVVPTNAVAQQLNSRSQVIISPNGVKEVQYLQPPVINSLLFADREYHFNRLYDLAGLNEQLVGVSNIKSGTSARQIAYLSELDGMKHKGTAQSIETMLVRAWKLTLQLVQYYYLDERLMRISAESGFDMVSFRGADIQGVTVDLAPRAGLERMGASKAAKAEADAEAGWLTVDAAKNQRQTGQAETQMEGLSRRAVQLQIKSALQGAQFGLDLNIDANVAIEEIQRIKNLLVDQGIDANTLYPLDQLVEGYMQLLQQQNQPPPDQETEQPIE